MARGRRPRYWVKIDCNGVLRGSINYLLTLEEQAVWIKLIAYSEVCGGPAGCIQDNEGNALPREFLAMELHCTVDILNSMIEKMTKDKAISSNGGGVMKLVNFESYQFTEYDRQKPYREAKKNAIKDPERFKNSSIKAASSHDDIDALYAERGRRLDANIKIPD
jgi:hypothetical protein